MSGLARDDMPDPPLRGRWFFFAIAWLSFGLGLLGALLPVLPTTPFMILAAWAFSKSSRRFHYWLNHHPRYGRRVREFGQHRVIPLPVKLTAFAAMLASLSYVVLLAKADWRWVTAMGAVMAIGVVYISLCPSRLPAEGRERDLDPSNRS